MKAFTNLVFGLLFAATSPIVAQTVSLSVASPQPQYDVGTAVPLSLYTTATNLSGITLVMVGNPLSVSSVPPPYNASVLTTPQTAGLASFQAAAILTSGAIVLSNVLTIDVEPAQTPTSIEVSPSQLTFTFRGEQSALLVLGQVGTSTVVLSNSTKLSIVSANPAIVSVGADKAITALTSGTTSVQVTWGTFSKTIPVSVNIAGPGDLNGDGTVDQDDVNLLLMYLNTTATVNDDALDFNHDGRIDNTDANLLAKMCTTQCTVSQSFASTDVNMDGVTDCADLIAVKEAMGSRLGQPGFNSHADIDGNAIVNVLDLARVAKALPAGTSCQ